MRLELTPVFSINDVWSIKLVYIGVLFLFPGVFTLYILQKM